MQRRLPPAPLFLTLAILAAGCASSSTEDDYATRFATSVKSSDARDFRAHKVLVVAMHTGPDFRDKVEDAFARDLEARGVRAVAAHDLLPDSADVTPPRLRDEARRAGADAILVAGVVRREQIATMDPGRAVGGRGNFHPGYPALSYQSYDQPPSTTVRRRVVAETSLFDADRGDLLWGARTNTFVTSDPALQIPKFARALDDKLQQDGLLPAPASPAAAGPRPAPPPR